ncbi:MAG: ATP-binding protein [Hyphomicrobiales bacterium]
MDGQTSLHPRLGAAASADIVGRIISVSGSQASLGLLAAHLRKADDECITVGKFVGVRRGQTLLVGMVTGISLQVPAAAREQGFQGAAQLDMMGEISRDGQGRSAFQRGITHYPILGDEVAALGSGELRTLYNISGARMIDVGLLQQDATIVAQLDIDEMLSKHFAVLGTTGVGKSSGVALILRETLKARPDLRMFLVDVHNEYANCFGNQAQVVNPRNLKLPFWFFNFEETVDVIFGGRPGVEDEVEVLSEVIPIAKSHYLQLRGPGDQPIIKRVDIRNSGFTVDTPVPYRLVDLVALIDERLGKLENRTSRSTYSRLISRIETVSNNPRYAFMFENANVGGDTMAEILSNLFRVPMNGIPVTIMQLAGFPAEVVDAVVSVICRMAFDFGLWSDGAIPLLFVCEEAHRYASADRSIGFGPTRKAISRIAKEGRKYGVHLGLVTQRPAELDPTIISQCSTLFVMRLTNDRDQALMRSAVSDAAANLLAFVPSLGTREVIAFGQGVALPTRMKFKELPPNLLKKSETVGSGTDDARGDVGHAFVSSVIERWRGATMSQKVKFEDPASAVSSLATPRPAPDQASQLLASDRFRILKKPLVAD